jgi:hypothetical protein
MSRGWALILRLDARVAVFLRPSAESRRGERDIPHDWCPVHRRSERTKWAAPAVEGKPTFVTFAAGTRQRWNVARSSR